jgi:SAM-dependent methyltransferase
MPETPVQIALRHAASFTQGPVLLLTPGPRGSELLKKVTAHIPLTYVALDSEPARLKDLPESVYPVIGTATRLPFRSRFFTAILSFEGLFSIRPPWTLLAEYHRVLVPDGKLFLFEPASEGLISGIRAKLLGPGKRVYKVDEVKKRLERADYVVEHVDPANTLAEYPLPGYALVAKKIYHPAEPAPAITTTREMKAKQKAHPGARAEAAPPVDDDQA